MNTKEFLQKELDNIRSERYAADSVLLKENPTKLFERIINYLPKEPPYHNGEILYTESDGDGYVVEYKMRRVKKGIEHVYCRYDLNLRTGEFEDNPRYLVYLNCIFRRATPKEQKMLEEAIREAPYKRTK